MSIPNDQLRTSALISVPGDKIDGPRRLMEVIDVERNIYGPKVKARNLATGTLHTITGPDVTMSKLVRPPEDFDNLLPPTPVPSRAIEVLRWIDEHMAAHDAELAELTRADHFRLCARGCGRCRPHRP